MHTFFALKDMCRLKIDEMDGEVVIRLDKSDNSTYASMDKMLCAWLTKSQKYENGENTKKVPNRNMANGVTKIRSWTPTRLSMLRFSLKKSAICFSLNDKREKER